jgi:predicted CXXCH cytochrome family protein
MNHLNGILNVSGPTTEIGAYSSPGIGNGYGTCGTITCHGDNNADWLASDEPGNLDCADCHGGASDVDDFEYLNGITALISMTEWNAMGHGRVPLECTTCHDFGVPHGGDDNFFRLKGGIDTICQTCHKDLTEHYGSRHSEEFNGGQLCFNCHDPHGDTPIKMIHDKPWLAHQSNGIPTKIADTDVNFTDNENWGDFVKAQFNGVCQICHESTTGIRNFYRYDTFPNVNGSYNTNHNQGFVCTECHKHNDFQPAGGCTICHSQPQGNRVAVVDQFNGDSHHIQGVELTDEHCYQCHWEANSDGSINSTYHGGWDAPGSEVNLVIYGSGMRPTSYSSGTAVEYMANGSRSEIMQLNDVCLGCHSTKNNSTQPFGDGKTPKQYAWDGKSIDERYSQTGTTSWGKYSDTSSTNITPKNKQTKAYSAHGNAGDNERGWNLSETWPNTSGSVDVVCYDCHNSHGSNTQGTTTSYASATTNGGIMKNTIAGKGGYTMTYMPQAGGSASDNNEFNAGAGLCFDCHLTQNAGSKPWGYKGTYGSNQAILGYFDTPYFGPGTSGTQQRYAYKAALDHMGGHFGASSPLTTPVTGSINGLCTPCHDPHGVSKTLGSNQKYALPMLKGTWMTSPYKEDVAPSKTNECRGGGRMQIAFCGASSPGYHIDQNTFSNWNFNSTASVNESDSQFAGLCMTCHPKSSINPNTNNSWRSVDRIHNSVKGWDNDGKTMHRYTCSKCHTPHNSALPRMVVTNCLDGAHRGRVESGGRPAKASQSGRRGRGSGSFPAGGSGSGSDGWGGGGNGSGGGWGRSSSDDGDSGSYFFGNRSCHDNTNSDSWPENQLWNVKTPWGNLGSGSGGGGGHDDGGSGGGGGGGW